MEVHFTPEQEAQLSQMSHQSWDQPGAIGEGHFGALSRPVYQNRTRTSKGWIFKIMNQFGALLRNYGEFSRRLNPYGLFRGEMSTFARFMPPSTRGVGEEKRKLTTKDAQAKILPTRKPKFR